MAAPTRPKNNNTFMARLLPGPCHYLGFNAPFSTIARVSALGSGADYGGPLSLQNRTCSESASMSAKCHQRISASKEIGGCAYQPFHGYVTGEFPLGKWRQAP